MWFVLHASYSLQKLADVSASLSFHIDEAVINNIVIVLHELVMQNILNYSQHEAYKYKSYSQIKNI